MEFKKSVPMREFPIVSIYSNVKFPFQKNLMVVSDVSFRHSDWNISVLIATIAFISS